MGDSSDEESQFPTKVTRTVDLYYESRKKERNLKNISQHAPLRSNNSGNHPRHDAKPSLSTSQHAPLISNNSGNHPRPDAKPSVSTSQHFDNSGNPPCATLSQPDAEPPVSHTPSVISLDEVSAYHIELISNEAVFNVSSGTYVMQDYDASRCQLKRLSFVLLESTTLLINGEFEEVWKCTCSPSRWEFIGGLPQVLNSACADIYHGCLHATVLKSVVGNLSSVTDHAYTGTVSFVDLPSSPGSVLVVDGKTVAVVTVQFRLTESEAPFLLCLTCRKETCRHVADVRSGLETETTPELDIIDMLLHHGGFESVNCSKLTVQFPQTFEPFVTNLEEVKLPKMSPSPCTTCTESSFLAEGSCRVYYTDDYQCVTVFSRVCDCGKYMYDGGFDPVLNFGFYAISHCVLRRYVTTFVTAGLPMYTFYKTWLQDLYMFTGHNLKSHLRYGMFRFAVEEFMNSIMYDEHDGFSCPDCGVYPDRPIFDGQTVGFPRKFFELDSRSESTAKLSGSSFQERVFLRDKETRKLFHLYATNADWSKDRHEDLKSLIKVYAPSLLRFLELNEYCPPECEQLLKDLAAPSPITAILLYQGELQTVCDKVVDGNMLTAVDLSILHRWCLPLFKCLREGFLDEALRPVLKDVVEMSLKLCMKDPHHLSVHPDLFFSRKLAHFPSLPVLRQRGVYAMDKERSNLESEQLCDKVAGRHPTLTPGVFMMMCEHGVCYGFEAVGRAESPDMVFTLVTQRFRHAPKWIIYDNACNAYQYSLNRNPGYFKDTRFVIDRLHQKNHKSCCSGHSIDSYQCMTNVNTQAVEQRHALIVKLKAMLSYMKPQNFMIFLKYFNWFHNGIKLGARFSQYPGHFEQLQVIFQKD